MEFSEIIKGGNTIYLRNINLNDVNKEYLSWLNDDEVMKGIVSSGYHLTNLKSYVIDKISNENTYFFAIILKSNNKHIGNIKLDFHDSKANVSELGILIGNKNYWGKGIAKEACSLMINYGFNNLKLRKIFLAVFETNIAAIRLYKSLGFQIEGKLIKHVYVDGILYDKYLMSIFSDDYLKK